MSAPQDSEMMLDGLAAARDALRASLWQQNHIPAEILELCRLRLAQLHRSETDIASTEFELAAEKRDALRTWNTSALFDAAQRACLSFAEVYAMDPAALSDEQADTVKVHYGDAGLVALIEALGIFDGAIRLNLLWGEAHER